MKEIGLIILGSLLALGGTFLSEKYRDYQLRKKLLELLGFEIGVNLVLASRDSYASHVFLSDLYSNYLQNLHLLEKEAREVILLHYKWIKEYEGLKYRYQSGVPIDRKNFEAVLEDLESAGKKAIDEIITLQKGQAIIWS